jgi:hypothetical protein
VRDYRVLILSTCSSLKRFPIAAECNLGVYKGEPYDLVLNNWLETIQGPTNQKFPAQDLYIGSNWKEVLSCAKTASSVGFVPQLWVVSAGWGLIPANYKITLYAASFSEGESSIHNLKWPQEFNSKQRSRSWWQTINQKRKLDLPSSIPQLYSSLPNKKDLRVLIILSKEYYLPLELEIFELISLGAEVVIISSGMYSELGVVHPIIKDHVLPLNTKFKNANESLKKNCHVLNASMATWLLENYHDELKKGREELYKALDRKRIQLNEEQFYFANELKEKSQ